MVIFRDDDVAEQFHEVVRQWVDDLLARAPEQCGFIPHPYGCSRKVWAFVQYNLHVVQSAESIIKDAGAPEPRKAVAKEVMDVAARLHTLSYDDWEHVVGVFKPKFGKPANKNDWLWELTLTQLAPDYINAYLPILQRFTKLTDPGYTRDRALVPDRVREGPLGLFSQAASLRPFRLATSACLRRWGVAGQPPRPAPACDTGRARGNAIGAAEAGARPVHFSSGTGARGSAAADGHPCGQRASRTFGRRPRRIGLTHYDYILTSLLRLHTWQAHVLCRLTNSCTQVVESDFTKGLSEMTSDEEAAQREYDQQTKENDIEKATKDKDVESKVKETAELEKAAVETKQDRSGVEGEHAVVSEYLSKIGKQCVEKAETFEDRKARFEADIAGLKEALQTLGDETAFVQRGASTHRLRGVSAHLTAPRQRLSLVEPARRHIARESAAGAVEGVRDKPHCVRRRVGRGGTTLAVRLCAYSHVARAILTRR